MINIFLKPEETLTEEEENAIIIKEFEIARNDYFRNSDFEDKYFSENSEELLLEFFNNYDIFTEKINSSLQRRVSRGSNDDIAKYIKRHDKIALDIDIEKTEQMYRNSKAEGKVLLRQILHGRATKQDISQYCNKYKDIIVKSADVIVPSMLAYVFIKKARIHDEDHQKLYGDIYRKNNGYDVDNMKLAKEIVKVLSKNSSDFAQVVSITKAKLDRKYLPSKSKSLDPSKSIVLNANGKMGTIDKLKSYKK